MVSNGHLSYDILSDGPSCIGLSISIEDWNRAGEFLGRDLEPFDHFLVDAGPFTTRVHQCIQEVGLSSDLQSYAQGQLAPRSPTDKGTAVAQFLKSLQSFFIFEFCNISHRSARQLPVTAWVSPGT